MGKLQFDNSQALCHRKALHSQDIVGKEHENC